MGTVCLILSSSFWESPSKCVAFGWGSSIKDTSRDDLFRTIESAHKQSILTEKELFIIRAVSKGYRNKEIAFDMGIAERTVKAHLTNIYNKLNVDSRSEAVSVSIKQCYISL